MFNKFKTTTLLAAVAAGSLLLPAGHVLALDLAVPPGDYVHTAGNCTINMRTQLGGWAFIIYDVSGDPRAASGGYRLSDGGSFGSPVIDEAYLNSCYANSGGVVTNVDNFGEGSNQSPYAPISSYGFEYTLNGNTRCSVLFQGVTGTQLVNQCTVIPDTTAPTVMFDEYPNALSGNTPFTVKTIFSEDVTGFNEIPADVDVVNGDITAISAGTLLPDGREEYTLTITPTGAGDVTITVPPGAAQDDPAGNDNIASAPLVIGNTIVADTQAAIAGFMLARANNLASNQPGLTRFLMGDGCGAFNANATEGSGSINGCASNGNTWAEISGSWSGDDSYTLGSFGAHGFVNPNLLVGGMVQFDYAEDSTNNASGNGYMIGPYFVAQVPDQPLFFEGRLLYGQTDNDISPLGTYTDSFETERWLAQLRATGEYQVQATTLMPLLDFTYTDDTQQAYTDSLGNTIPGQTVSLMQLTAGMNFSTPISVSIGALELTGGLSGIYSSTDGGAAAPEFENLRGRTHLGLNYVMASGATLSATTFYDGLGTDYESYGASLGFDVKF